MTRSSSAIYQPKKKSVGINFDPRTKILLLLELDVLLFMGRSLAYESLVILFCAITLWVGGQGRSAMKHIMIFCVFVMIQLLIAPYLENPFVSLLHFLVVVVRKLLPCLMLGKLLIATTEVSAFISAMWKIKLPKEAIITTSVIFRCFPTIKEEWSAIRTAMKMRGIELNFRQIVTKPAKTATYMLVPLFISTLNISDELAAAALCRGLDNPGEHTCMNEICFQWYDILFLTLATLWLIVMLFLMVRGCRV